MASPNPEDLAARQKAIDAGETQYVRPSNGERYTIRNLGNRRHKKNYGGQGGRDEKYVSRSGNRGNKVDNPRAFNLRHGSPPGTDIAEGDRAMARVRAANPGMDADHINDIARSSAGASWKVQQGRGTYEEYFENMKKAGIPVGHTEENLAPLEPHLNQIVKNQETQVVDKAIKNAGSEADNIFGMFRNAVNSVPGGKAILGTVLPAALGFGFDAADAVEKTDKANKPDATELDKFQAKLAQSTAATSLVPEPLTQAYNMGSGLLNSGIDLIRAKTHEYLIKNRRPLSLH